MMPALRGGGWGVENVQILWTNSTDRLHEMRTRGREGDLKSKSFADIICKRPLKWRLVDATTTRVMFV